jgi:hypothetical protein
LKETISICDDVSFKSAKAFQGLSRYGTENSWMQSAANRLSLEMDMHECHGFSAEWGVDCSNVKYLVDFGR